MGTLDQKTENFDFHDSHLEIDIERLKRPDPILFYDEMVLYEDELADNGCSILSARVVSSSKVFSFLLK